MQFSARLQEDRRRTRGGATAAEQSRSVRRAAFAHRFVEVASLLSPVGYRIPTSPLKTEPDTRCAVVNSYYEPSKESVIPLPSPRNEKQA